MEFKIGYFTPAITVGFCQHFEFLPAATKLGQGNIFTGVCQEFCPQGGGGCLPQCMLGYTPPQEQTHPPEQTHNPRADPPTDQVDPPREQTPHPPTSPDQADPPGADTPPGADSPPPGSRL